MLENGEQNILANVTPPSILTFTSVCVLVAFFLGEDQPEICHPLIFL
jgi:hypothetical protein